MLLRTNVLRHSVIAGKVVQALLQKHCDVLIDIGQTPGLICGVTTADGEIEEIYACGKRNIPAGLSQQEKMRHQLGKTDGLPFLKDVESARFATESGSVEKNDLMHIGSCSKAMTSTAFHNIVDVLKIKRENGDFDASSGLPLLTMDSKLVDFLPENLRGACPNLEQATLQQFLDHRSGLNEKKSVYGVDVKNPLSLISALDKYHRCGYSVFNLMQEYYWRQFLDIDPAVPDSKLYSYERTIEVRHNPLEAVLQSPLFQSHDRSHVPGREWGYSNFGYSLAAYMVEKATKQSWESLIKEYLFEPLKMESAGFGEPTDRNPTAPASHSVKGLLRFKFLPEEVPRRQRSFVPAIVAPAGDISITMPDWLKFLRYHVNVIRTDPDFISSRGKVVPPYYLNNEYSCISRGSPESNYRNGWISDESLKCANQVRHEAGQSVFSWQTAYQKVVGKAPLEGVAKKALPFNLSHDGSHGGQYCYCILLPDPGIAAAIWMNSSSLQHPFKSVLTIKRLLREIDPTMTEEGKRKALHL